MIFKLFAFTAHFMLKINLKHNLCIPVIKCFW